MPSRQPTIGGISNLSGINRQDMTQLNETVMSIGEVGFGRQKQENNQFQKDMYLNIGFSITNLDDDLDDPSKRNSQYTANSQGWPNANNQGSTFSLGDQDC